MMIRFLHRMILVAGAIIICAMVAFPPWHVDAGAGGSGGLEYGFILSPPVMQWHYEAAEAEINVGLLAVQILAVVCGLGLAAAAVGRGKGGEK